MEHAAASSVSFAFLLLLPPLLSFFFCLFFFSLYGLLGLLYSVLMVSLSFRETLVFDMT
ncbi:hypothetical protein RchiOBHm_Chr2g0121121 [Rosa chinensis]|uniref:Uncharacterized protein n=1 Tax=Rosa chinensis TaxID=74649 RepID=A0A2P6RSF8_ROSCH|nr:hypothetical protein RchiOBHm_Chr2g0121121 [Rosa chinensis]